MSSSKPVITFNENGEVRIGPGFWKRVFGGGSAIVIIIGLAVNGMDQALHRVLPAAPAPVTVSAPEFEAAVEKAIQPIIDANMRGLQMHIMEPMHLGSSDRIVDIETELGEVNETVASIKNTIGAVQSRQLSIQSTQGNLQRGQMEMNTALDNIQRSLDDITETNGG